MANRDIITFNITSFICALFVLEFGADKFIDHAVVVANRTGIPQALIGLLIAGAEWEELVVVIVSVARNRSSLAIGNIVGSTISNILGAFSLGLLFHSTSQRIVFDKSCKVYSLLLLILTIFVTLLHFLGTQDSGRIFGGVLLALFVTYVFSVTLAISGGAITAPELSDDDDDSESNNSDSEVTADEPTASPGAEAVMQHWPLHRHRHSLQYHIAFLFFGFISICLSGYVLSHASTTISDEIGMSDVLFGVVVLSIATTLPEKFIAVLSGVRGQAGILVANTVGSNIFLLSLCMGIVFVVTAGDFDAGLVNVEELGVMMGSTIALTATVWFGGKWSRWIGAAMLMAYIAFLVLEFTVIRKA